MLLQMRMEMSTSLGLSAQRFIALPIRPPASMSRVVLARPSDVTAVSQPLNIEESARHATIASD
jgi:hypothetical protein